MATYFINPATGVDNNTDAEQGSSWEKPYATLWYALQSRASNAGMIAGDIAVCADNATETAANTYLRCNASYEYNDPYIVISATPATGTAINYSPGFKIQRTGASEVIIARGCANFYGITLETTGTSSWIELNGGESTYQGPIWYYDCTFNCRDRIMLNNSDYAVAVNCYNCTFRPGQAANPTSAHMVVFGGKGTEVNLYNCTISAVNGSTTNYVLGLAAGAHSVNLFGCDMSSMDETTRMLLASTYGSASRVRILGCKLPAGWSTTGLTWLHRNQSLLIERSNDPSSSARSQIAEGLELYSELCGTVEHNTANYRTGGASDGTSAYSWKFTGNSTYCDYYGPLTSPPITSRCPGDHTTAYDVTVHFASTISGATTADIWFNVLYPNSTTSFQDGYTSNKPDPGAAGAAYSSGGTWTGSGATSTYSKTFTITPYYPGPIQIVPHVATSTAPIYVCTKVDIAAAS